MQRAMAYKIIVTGRIMCKNVMLSQYMYINI